MEIKSHSTSNGEIAEVKADAVIVQKAEDALDVMGNVYYQGFEKMILHEKNLTPDFFDLKNKMAGEILQKFSNYRMQLAIVGDYSKFTSSSLSDFIRESNSGKQVYFAASLSEAVDFLSR